MKTLQEILKNPSTILQRELAGNPILSHEPEPSEEEWQKFDEEIQNLKDLWQSDLSSLEDLKWIHANQKIIWT